MKSWKQMKYSLQVYIINTHNIDNIKKNNRIKSQ